MTCAYLRSVPVLGGGEGNNREDNLRVTNRRNTEFQEGSAVTETRIIVKGRNADAFDGRGEPPMGRGAQVLVRAGGFEAGDTYITRRELSGMDRLLGWAATEECTAPVRSSLTAAGSKERRDNIPEPSRQPPLQCDTDQSSRRRMPSDTSETWKGGGGPIS
jgi:hypothetical protein